MTKPNMNLEQEIEEILYPNEKGLSYTVEQQYRKILALITREKKRCANELIKEIERLLPEELGYDDYDKHMHSYIHENRGNCEICGLSFKLAGQYELYNNGIIACKNVLKVVKNGESHDS